MQRTSKLPPGLRIDREFGGRFAMGADTEVRLKVQNSSPQAVTMSLKDEYPPQLRLNGLREGQLRVGPQQTATLIYSLTAPRRGRFVFGGIAVRFVSPHLVWCQTRVISRSRVSRSIQTCGGRVKRS